MWGRHSVLKAFESFLRTSEETLEQSGRWEVVG